MIHINFKIVALIKAIIVVYLLKLKLIQALKINPLLYTIRKSTYLQLSMNSRNNMNIGKHRSTQILIITCKLIKGNHKVKDHSVGIRRWEQVQPPNHQRIVIIPVS